MTSTADRREHDAPPMAQALCEACGEDSHFHKCEFSGRAVRSSVIDPHSKAPIGLLICGRCGVGMQDPMLDDGYQEKAFAKRINSVYGFEVEGKRIDTPIQVPWIGVSLSRAKTCYETLQRAGVRLTAHDRVCDYGAYSGIFLHALREIYGCEVMGLELNEEGRDFARAVYGIEITPADFYSYRPERDRMSMVTLVHAFEHLRYPRRFLQHVTDHVLDRDGLVYIEVPNLFGYVLSPAHHYHYCEDSLGALLERMGFSVLDLHTTGFPELPHFKVGEAHPSWLVCLARFTGKPRESYPDAQRVQAQYYSAMRYLDGLISG